MTMILKTGAALVLSTALVGAAQTTTQAATPAAQAPAANASANASAGAFSGPAVPGVCLLAQEAVVVNAKVGQAATARLRELAQAAERGFEPERKAITDEAKTLDGDKAKLSAAQLQSRQQALAQRAQAFQVKAAQLQQQVEATRQKALARIGQDEQPVVEAVYKAHGCGVLFARGAVLAGGQGMDLTPAVVQGLDAKVSTISFELEPVPAATSAQTKGR